MSNDSSGNGPREEEKFDAQSLIHKAELDPDIPTFYFNNIAITGDKKDLSILLCRGGNYDKAIAVLYVPHTVAKVLASGLSEIVEAIEKDTGLEFPLLKGDFTDTTGNSV